MNKITKINSILFDSYKRRLYSELTTNGLSCKDISINADMKLFVTKYVEDLHSKVTSNAILGISFRLANLNIEGKEHNLEYPVINKYHNHDIIGSYYFKKDESNKIDVGYIELIPSKIII